MPTILKRTKTENGPQATLAKYEDACTLLDAIRNKLEERMQNQPGPGWSDFGDAGRLLEDLKNVGDWLGIARNEVIGDHACPDCYTCDADRLEIDEEERVRCTVCQCEYKLD
ncbi:MAG TPA: hypothetical protein VLA12_15215 [Planctomycetaceae bacterium]|nr:hypothetical protein [Planctomycetaceae bacterium]